MKPVDVSDVFRGASVSIKRENVIRGLLGLDPLQTFSVEIAATQRVVARAGHGKRRGYRTFRVYASGEEADRLEAAWKASGADSFSDYVKGLHNDAPDTH